MIHARGGIERVIMDSILNSVKVMLGISSDYTPFDTEIIIHINSVFTVIFQLGVGPQDKPFFISGAKETWSDFSEDISTVNLVKSYTYLKVRLLFDPPTSSGATEAINNQIKEFEWRLCVEKGWKKELWMPAT